MQHFYVTTSIPYVNAAPHIGHALELVQADVLARHRRLRGDAVRLQSGTDDNALKNVTAAAAAGVPPREYVAANGARFSELGKALDLSLDDFVQTGSDPRHRPAAESLWHACRDSGDLYQRSYTGLYCTGCEAFYPAAELVGDNCPEHGTPVEQVTETNWFFRLSRYQDQLHDLISSDRLRVLPAARKREVLAFIDSGLRDFSVSRDAARARGWGIGVPGDPGQVIYVWYDALVNYLSGLGYPRDDAVVETWWGPDSTVAHVVGKGILRFHAVYWPAMLLSAGLRTPDRVYVHEYLTADGAKISKSTGNVVDPADVAAAHGADALRWWLVRDVARAGDTDYTEDRLLARATEDLANTVGNLVSRVTTLARRTPPGPDDRDDSAASAELRAVRAAAPADIDTALADFDLRRASATVLGVAAAANRYADATRPWELTAAGEDDRARGVLAELLGGCGDLARELAPFTPALAERIEAALRSDRRIPAVFPRPVRPAR